MASTKLRTKQTTIILIILLAVVGLVLSCGGLSEPTVTSKPTAEEIPPAPAAFQTAELAINPAEVNPGEKVTITAKVTNTGDTEDKYTAGLRINNVTEASSPTFYGSEEVTMAAGESQSLSFVVSMDTPGIYKVTWGELTGEFVVVRPGEPTEAGSPEITTATFQTASLAINPAEVNSGVKVMITAKVTNSGNTEGDYIAELRIDNLTKTSLPAFRYSDKVSIAAGASQLVSVIVSMTTPATYKVTWGELTGEFVVVKPEPTEPSNPQIATPKTTAAPNFTGVDVVTNKTISLSQFKGSVVLLNFVNYGCNPDVNRIVSAQLLAIKELTKQRDDFMPLSVFCGCCPEDTLRNFATENDLTWPWILDADNSIVRQYAGYLRKYGYPTLIFIDKGQYIREVTGYCDVSTLSVKIDETSQY